jgi:leucyl/phenylalanyl-tRNA--protein transferase
MSLFPDPRQSTPEGIVAVGGDLQVSILKEAYSRGIFPWPQEGLPLLWFSPDPRGVLDFEDFHVPASLKKFAKGHPDWRFTINQALPEVLKACRRQQRPGQEGTWITHDMQEAYIQFFSAGYVKSLECWEQDDLIGGIYGVDVNNVFSGESMFYRKPNASKMCLWKMVEHLQSKGRTWMDIQMLTSVTESMGGKYISRDEFLERLDLHRG